ncbi:MAG: electron transfer flavoprotein subunit alpha/FixB family protein [Planctomycetes bacterium]|nr:electron transfer flavoprotein subunit alpha/FixB family protein [Planctomycetota bacterium]
MSSADTRLWVIDTAIRDGTLERLGDARRLADRLATRVGVIAISQEKPDADRLARHGADRVIHVAAEHASNPAVLPVLSTFFDSHRPWLVIAPADCHGRELAARLAARKEWRLFSPVLMVQARGREFDITAVDRTEKLCRRERIPVGEPAVVTMRDGVGEPVPAAERHGDFSTITVAHDAASERVVVERTIPADPATVDIRFAPKLVAGGRGLGNKEGFDALRKFADRLGAGVAASRVAVDMGWIEHARQVGQTGHTVKPELYIACGISGASHHLEGMSGATHIIAINTDPQAPIFRKAHLGLIADLYAVLRHAGEGLE